MKNDEQNSLIGRAQAILAVDINADSKWCYSDSIDGPITSITRPENFDTEFKLISIRLLKNTIKKLKKIKNPKKSKWPSMLLALAGIDMGGDLTALHANCILLSTLSSLCLLCL